MPEKTLVVSYWYEPESNELVFDWPKDLKGVSARIKVPLPAKPEFANQSHIDIFSQAQGLIAGQLMKARINLKGPVELNPLTKKPSRIQEPNQLSFL